MKTVLAKNESFADGFWEGEGLPRQFLGELLLFGQSLLPAFLCRGANHTLHSSLIVPSPPFQTFWKHIKQRRKKVRAADVPREPWAELAALEQGWWGLRGNGFFSLAQKYLNSRNMNFPSMFQRDGLCGRCCVWDGQLCMYVCGTAQSDVRRGDLGSCRLLRYLAPYTRLNESASPDLGKCLLWLMLKGETLKIPDAVSTRKK